MNSLELQKRLLLAESELNRAQLCQEWQALAEEVHALAEQAKTIRSMAAAAGSLVAGLAACRHKAATPPGEKLPWWQTLLKGAGVVSSFWNEFRSRPKS